MTAANASPMTAVIQSCKSRCQEPVLWWAQRLASTLPTTGSLLCSQGHLDKASMLPRTTHSSVTRMRQQALLVSHGCVDQPITCTEVPSAKSHLHLFSTNQSLPSNNLSTAGETQILATNLLSSIVKWRSASQTTGKSIPLAANTT